MTDPGWYADPEMAGTQRYWDGAAWTEHRAPMTPVEDESTIRWLMAALAVIGAATLAFLSVINGWF